MIAPFYNSRSTKFAVVTEGSGYVEILSPHFARQDQHGSRAQRYREQEEEERQERGTRRYREEEQERRRQYREQEKEEEEYQEGEKQGQRYRQVRSRISRGTVFIVPAGYPVVEVASDNNNLQAICFEISADKNERVFLAGLYL